MTKRTLTPGSYRAIREAIGTRAEVCDLLGIHHDTLRKREAGNRHYPISREASLALLALLSALVEPDGKTVAEFVEAPAGVAA